MAKKKLNKEQNMALQGLSLQEKLNLLHDWKKEGTISQEQFNFFSNHWITKDGKKIVAISNALKKTADENRGEGKLTDDIEMEKFLQNMQNKLNLYLASRLPEPLQKREKEQFRRYVSKSRNRTLSNRVLVLALRYPDKELNEMAVELVKTKKKDRLLPDIHFWSLLWADNLVPMDAVRLMLKKNKDGYYEIDPCFSPVTIKDLLPLIEAQRDKEITRLKWAQSLEGHEREREIARKTRRLNAFNLLLEAAGRYV